jgi:hypothetical protein
MEHRFAFAEIQFVRIKIVRKEGKVAGVEEHYDDGTVNFIPRTN